MSKYLKEKRNDLLVRAEAILTKAKEEKRELNEEEKKELEEIKGNIRSIDETNGLNDEFETFKKYQKKNEDPENKEVKTRAIEGMGDFTVVDAEYRAFEAYLRSGEINERADMTKTDNGAVIPTSIARWIIRKVYNICPVLERSSKYNIKGKLDLPYYPADSNNIVVDFQEEFQEITSSAGKISSISLTGFLAGALTKISRSLINNSDFDIVGFIVDEMSYAIKRFIEDILLNGRSGKVTGLSTLTNKITAGSATAITAEELIKLQDSIKDEYQQDAIWIMSSKTRTAIRALKSNTGYFLLNNDISSPFGRTLLGKPVYVSDNMPEIAAGKDVIYYGDLKGLATKFAEDINIDVLRERFATQHVVGVIGWFEFDSKVANEQMLAKLTMGA